MTLINPLKPYTGGCVPKFSFGVYSVSCNSSTASPRRLVGHLCVLKKKHYKRTAEVA
jgi:hypothetical protein